MVVAGSRLGVGKRKLVEYRQMSKNGQDGEWGAAVNLNWVAIPCMTF